MKKEKLHQKFNFSLHNTTHGVKVYIYTITYSQGLALFSKVPKELGFSIWKNILDAPNELEIFLGNNWRELSIRPILVLPVVLAQVQTGYPTNFSIQTHF